MIIGIDASRASIKQKTGTEVYSYNLIKHLAKCDHKNQYILYTNRALKFDFLLPKNFKVKVLSFLKFWTQIRLAWEMLIRQPDILFIPAHTIPWIHPKNTVVTIHGLEYEHFPEAYSRFDLWHLRKSTRLASKWAKKIITISQNTKKDLIKFYGVRDEQIKVVHLGYQKYEVRSKKYEAAGTFRFPKPYLLFVGRLEKRKNLVRLVKAFARLKNNKKIVHKLVLAGKPGYGYEQIKCSIKELGVEKDVILPGYVLDKDLPDLMKNADIFVYPSLYEGFGMPILEAMNLGVPVVASNISALPEIAGEAALLVDPLNTDEIADAIWRVVTNKELKEDLVKKGLEQVKKFSWEKCAKETLIVLESLR